MRIANARQVSVRLLLGASVLLLAGCDYWPPALLSQIEQLKQEVQQSAAERATLEEQLNTATKLRNDLQARIDEVTHTNGQLTGRVHALENDLMAERRKLATLTEAMKKPGPKKSAKASPSPKGKKKKAERSGKKGERARKA